MIINYYKTALRNILKYRAFSFINVAGLALSMSVCMLIMLMIDDQTAYDQFHEKKDRIYRILTAKPNAKIGLMSAATSSPLAKHLETDYPVVEQATRLELGIGGDATYNGKAVELRGYFADPSLFRVFSYSLINGNEETALVNPNSMIITQTFAFELFGADDPIGKSVDFADRGLNLLKGVDMERPATPWGRYTITGIIDESKIKTHLRFDALVSAASLPLLVQLKLISNHFEDWTDHNTGYTYVLVARDKNAQNLASALDDVVNRQYSKAEDARGLRLVAQKLSEITPGIFVSSPPSLSLPLEAYYFLGLLGSVIMFSACLNYTNLSTARALSRAKEIGVRKITGAKRSSLIAQFLSESILTSLLSLGLAIALLFFIRPAFNNLWINGYLNFNLRGTPGIYMIFVGFAIVIGAVAGIYPAFRLSALQPIHVLKRHHELKRGRIGIQKFLSATQFIISLFFIITSLLIYSQFSHHLTIDYGFTSENVINVPLQSAGYHEAQIVLSKTPGVISISASDEIPGSGQGTHSINVKKAGSAGDAQRAVQFKVDDKFIENLDIKLIAGRNLPVVESDRDILVNERFAQAMGYPDPSMIVGQLLQSEGSNLDMQVVGVVRDFRFRMPTEQDGIDPVVLRHQNNFRFLQVKVATSDIPALISALQKSWMNVDPHHPLKYQFYDEQLRATNKGVLDLVSIIGFITILAVTISCLGLLGIIVYQTERRHKEIGIRKVLGAEALAITFELSKSFFKMLGVSICIGVPISYFMNNLWLQNFPNRVNFGFDIIISGIVLLLILGLITIASQTVRAACRNPVEALRRE